MQPYADPGALLQAFAQLGEEGAIQVFRPHLGGSLLLGAVGQLQFEVVLHRLEHEYGVKASKAVPLKGIAFDGGKGIKDVSVSTDNGTTWTPTELGHDLGRYSFREWKLPVKLIPGDYDLRVRATNNAGDTQPIDPGWNPAGYLRNVVEAVRVTAT